MHITTIARAGHPFPGSAFETPLYRIPALTVTAPGRILVAYDVRSDWRDLPADFDIALVSSDDAGKTWSAPRALRRHTPGHGFGDASFIYDPSTGNIHCWYVGSSGESYFSATAQGKGLELWLATSTDEGETWTHRDMSHLRPPRVAGMFAASGNGAVLADGTLIQPFVARIDECDYAICALSWDRGGTWNLGEPVGPGCDENKVIGLADGRVLMHARAAGHRRCAWSSDRGKTFTPAREDERLTDPACNGGLARVGSVLVASMCDHPSERTRLALHVSVDEGATWSPAILIDSGAAAYSAACALDESTLALVWEADDYRSIVCAVIGLDELGVLIEDGAPSWDDARVRITPRRGTPGSAKPPVVNPA